MKWQPIETAPKDGTRVLLNIFIPSDGDHPSANGREFGYFQRTSGKWLIHHYPFEPTDGSRLTHWMPDDFPEPPEVAE